MSTGEDTREVAFPHFEYIGGELTCDGVSLRQVAAEFGTPCYVYSKNSLIEKYHEFDAVFSHFPHLPHLVCYSVKANSNRSVISTFVRAGSGLDVNSGGELYRALLAGGDAARIIFTGVGKTAEEIAYALEQRVLFLKVESFEELDVIDAVARRMGVRAPVALRVNPDVDALTHPYISTGLAENKFGIPWDQALPAYEHAASLPNLEIVGVDMHIGSQITTVEPFVEAASRLAGLFEILTQKGIPISHIDLGGGLGISYDGSPSATASELAEALRPVIESLKATIVLEPGRYLTGNAGVLLTTVQYRKNTGAKQFLIVDAAMNDLLRPALYAAYHRIQPVMLGDHRGEEVVDVVGPVCESSDFIAKGRTLPRVERGEVLAVMSAGAYGFVMSSNYNSRPRAAEVLIEDGRAVCIRYRETYEDLVRREPT